MTTITKEKKKEIVNELCENISKQEGVFFINFKGIKGNDSGVLRSKLKKGEAKMTVARKTLAKIAFQKEGIDFDPLSLEGEVGFVFSFGDSAGVAKIIKEFKKEEKISILGGVFEGKNLSAKEVEEIADLPTREELLSKLVGSISSPASGFLQVLQGNTRDLLTVLSKAKS